MTEEEKAKDRETIIDASAEVRNSLYHILEAQQHLTLALMQLDANGVEGLGWFRHYRDHMIEMHRVLAQEHDRRWGSIAGPIASPDPGNRYTKNIQQD